MKRFFSFSCAFLVLFLTFGTATYNNDWDAYLELYNGIKPVTDLFYKSFFNVFNAYNISYEIFYTLNQSLIYLLLLYFAVKTEIKSIFIIAVMGLFILGPNLSILLRYYTAYSFLLLGFYNCIVVKHKFTSILFILLALVSHMGIIVFIPFLLFYKFIGKISILMKIIISLGIYLSSHVLNGLLIKFNILTFSLYIEEKRSSFLGGALAICPYFLWLFLIWLTDRYVKQRYSNTNITYDFLYNLSTYSFLFLIPAFFLQICIHRIIQPLTYVWIIYIIYSTTYLLTSKTKYFINELLALVWLASLYIIYIMPVQFIGFSEWGYHLLVILASNKYNLFSFLTF